MKAITALLSEDGTVAGISTMRAAVLFILVVTLVPNAWLTIKTGVDHPVDWSTVGLCMGALGVKGWQRSRESDAAKTEPLKSCLSETLTKGTP